MTRSPRALLSLAALALSACTGAPSHRVTWRETWEMLVLTSRGQVLDARVTVGNTGLLRGQGHVRLDRWMDGAAPLAYRRLWSPAEAGVYPDRDRVRLGTDRLEMERHAWTLELHSDVTNAVVHLAPTDTLAVAPSPMMTATGQWTSAVTVAAGRASGWVEAGERGGQIDGRGVLLYRGGDGLPRGPRRTVVLLGAGVSVGLEEHGGGTLAWAHLEGEELDPTGARLVQAGGGWMLDFPAADLVVQLQGRTVRGVTALYPDLLLPGRLGLGLLGQRTERSVQALQGTLVRPSGTVIAPGVLVQVSSESERIDLPRRRRK